MEDIEAAAAKVNAKEQAGLKESPIVSLEPKVVKGQADLEPKVEYGYGYHQNYHGYYPRNVVIDNNECCCCWR